MTKILRIFTLLFVILNIPSFSKSEVVINHSSVDEFDLIPEEYINEVKKMMINIPGESHARGYMYGLELVEQLDPKYGVEITWSDTPETPTDGHLRAVRSYHTGTGWSNSGGEEDFYTSPSAREMMKNHLSRMRSVESNPIDAFGFGWCWDMTWQNSPGGIIDPFYGVRWAGSSEGGPDGNIRWGIDDDDTSLTGNSVNLYSYINAVIEYNTHDPDTMTFFTTGPVDGEHGTESGFQRYLKHKEIRDYVTDNGGILFDYADILSWKDGVQYMDSWEGNYFPNGDPDMATGGTGYDGGEGGSHISQEGCLHLGKAIWVMMAKIAGWSGGTTTAPSVTTAAVTTIKATSAFSGGNVVSSGGSPITKRGICWALHNSPTTSDNCTFDGTGIGSYVSTMNDLSPGTTYYIRAYASNAFGTSYGDLESFTTGISFSLLIKKFGSGSGTVTSSPPGINCGSDCSAEFRLNSNLTLTVVTEKDSKFLKWTGYGCSSNPCTLTMDQDYEIGIHLSNGFSWDFYIPAIIGNRNR